MSETLGTYILALYKEGKTYAQIQEMLGCAKSTISYHVGAGQKQKSRDRASKQRRIIRNYIQQHKEQNCCVDCGQSFRYWVMQLDHLPQFEKSFNLARFHNHTNDLEVVKAEIAKCDLVCSNCHANRTHYRRLVNAKTDEVFEDELD